ncbi:MAG: hypothetical protein LBF88_12855 [Planctomycetaceae bacterium]|jgi:hypothetical protein|nr:hypothetical protein [Planctomycetaceae bacterium]
MKIVYVFIVVLIVPALVFAEDENDVTPSPVSILKKIADTRRSIKSGYFLVEFQTQILGKPSSSQQWDIYFDGAKLRSDRKLGGNKVEVVCLDCYSKYTRLYYTYSHPASSDMRNALVFYDGYDKPGIRFAIPDPRWIGCLALPFLGSINVQAPLIYDYNYKENGDDIKILSDVIDRKKCWKIIFPSPLSAGASTISVWVDQSVWEHIVRVECYLSSNGTNYLDRIDIQSETRENYWFPSKIVYQRQINGKIDRTSETTIKVLSINKPLSSDIFSPKGINFLKPGTPVAWHWDRDRPVVEGRLEWDGDKVVGVDEFSKIMQESRRLQPFNLFLIFLGTALICFGICLKLLKKIQTLK